MCPEHSSYILWDRNTKFGRHSKFGVLILRMAEWCIPLSATLTLTLTSSLISRLFVSGAYYLLFYSELFSNVSYARPIPFGAFVTCVCDISCFSCWSLIVKGRLQLGCASKCTCNFINVLRLFFNVINRQADETYCICANTFVKQDC